MFMDLNENYLYGEAEENEIEYGSTQNAYKNVFDPKDANWIGSPKKKY